MWPRAQASEWELATLEGREPADWAILQPVLPIRAAGSLDEECHEVMARPPTEDQKRQASLREVKVLEQPDVAAEPLIA